MIPKSELKLRRRLVREFIRVDSAKVSFARVNTERTKTDSGGYVDGPPVTVPPQVVRLIVAKRRYGSALVNSEAGDIEKWPYSLIGPHNLNIAEEDTFMHLGQAYQVKTIEPDREERTLAALDFYGEHHELIDNG